MAKLTHQYRLYPFGEQAETLERWLVLSQRLYNAALEQRRAAWALGRSIGYLEQQAELVALKREMPEYRELPSHVLQNVLLKLDRAFQSFFRRCGERRAGKKLKLGFPRFKAALRYSSLTCPDRYPYLRDGALHFPKLGRIRMRMHRPLPEGSAIKSCTIKKKADGWSVSFSLEVPEAPKPVHAGSQVGIDVGLESFAVLSDGKQIESPKFLRKAERRLRKAQRVLSRRKRGSRRRERQVQKVARAHLAVARKRDDWQWKLAEKLARSFSLIVIEDLNIRGMVRNPHLSKSISDASWGAFAEKLEHAVVKTGSRLVKVDPRGTSQRCSDCGRDVPKPLSERWHLCPFCGLSIHRDHNAARNILLVGQGMAEVTPVETRPPGFRYRKVRPVVEAGTVPEQAQVA